jgi:hypothetical protein
MTVITKIKIGSEDLDFSMEGEDRIIRYKGKSYKILLNLINACPQLSQDENNLIPLAKCVVYLLFGTTFTVIENPSLYREKYWKRMIDELHKPFPPDEWKVAFDVDILLPPIISENYFFICLEDSVSSLPYLLTVPYPFDSLLFEFDLQPVPLAEK